MFKFIEMSLVFMIFSGVFSFVFNYNHLLNSLLSLELISLSIFFFLIVKYTLMTEEIFSLYFLVMVVCESVLGLGLLILISWSYGMDYFKTINMLVC